MPSVIIDGFHADVLTSKNFDYNPIADLEIYNCNSEEDINKLKCKYKIDKRIKIKIDQFSQKEASEVYPEKSHDALLRLIKQWDKI